MINSPGELGHENDNVNQAGYHLSQAHGYLSRIMDWELSQKMLATSLDPKEDVLKSGSHSDMAACYSKCIFTIGQAMGYLSLAAQRERLLVVHLQGRERASRDATQVADLQHGMGEWRYKAQYLERELALLRRPWWVKLRDWVYSRGLNPKTGIHPDYEPED